MHEKYLKNIEKKASMYTDDLVNFLQDLKKYFRCI